MAETELLIKVATSGAGQAVRDVLNTQKALAGVAQAASDARKFAEELGKRLNLPSKDVDDLADAIQQAKQETGQWRDEMGRLRDANGRFVKEAKDGFDSVGNSITKTRGSLGSLLDGILQGVGQQITQGFTEAIGKVTDLAGQALELGAAFNGAQAKVSTLIDDVDGLTVALDGVREATGNQVSTIDLLGGAYDIASAGFTNAGDAATIAEASVRGAIGGFSEFGTVADATTSVLNAYGLGAEKAAEITDKFIATQNAGKITVDQYAQQIGKVAPLAAQAGISLDELNGFIATATVSGVQVESSFSGLRAGLAAVLKPSSEAVELSKQLGVQFDAQALKTKGLAGILAELNAKGADTPEILTQLFGSVEAVAAIAPSAGAGLKNLQANIEASANSAGDAEEAFRKVSESLPGQIQALQTGFQQGLTSIGTAFEPLLTGLVTFTNDTLGQIGENFDGFDPIIEAGERLKLILTENPELAQRLGEAFGGIANVAVDQIGQIIDAISALVSNEDVVNGVAEGLADVATALEGVGEATQFVIALVDALFSLETNFQSFLSTVSDFPVVGAGVATGLSLIATTLQNLVNPINTAIDGWQALKEQIVATGIASEGIGGQLTNGLNKANEALGQLGQKQKEITQAQQQQSNEPPKETIDLKAQQEAEQKRQDAAKAQADRLKELRETEKRESTEAFRDTADAAKDAFADETTAAKRATDDRIEQRKRAVDAEIEADKQALAEKEQLIKDELATRSEALKQRQSAERDALNATLKAEQEAFDKRQSDEKKAQEDKFSAEERAIERKLQLEAASPEERKKLEEQFKSEDKDRERRQKAFAQLEKERLEFEAKQEEERKAEEERIAAEQAALAQKQAEEQAALEEEKRAAELALQQEKLALEESINQRKLELEDEIKAIKIAAEDELEQRKRAFEAEQREAERAFNDQQRALDKANAEQVASILKSARSGGQSLRGGGIAEGGVVQVHKDEFLVPPRGTRVVSQAESRALIRESLAQVPAVSVPAIAASNADMTQRLDAILNALESRPPVRFGGDQITFVNESNPFEASAAQQMAKLRARVRGLGGV